MGGIMSDKPTTSYLKLKVIERVLRLSSKDKEVLRQLDFMLSAVNTCTFTITLEE